MDKLSSGTGRAFGALWQHLVHIDPVEREQVRRRQIVQLARYMRQSVLQWDEVETNELEAYLHELIDLLNGEGQVRGMTENR